VNQFGEAVGRRLPGFARPMAKRVLHAWPQIDRGGRLLPDYIVIGTQRGGTSSLYNYLVQHPAVGRAQTKELRFFDRYYGKGVDWYRACLPSAASRERLRRRSGLELVVGEASPDYLFSPHAPMRVHELLPAVKLIVLLRDPVERAWSGYRHEVELGHETLPFEEAVERESERLERELERMLEDPMYWSVARQRCSYLARGRYLEQLRNWMELFPRERLLVLRSEDFYANQAAVYRTVQEFLGLPPFDLGRYATYNATRSAGMEPAMRARLSSYFRLHNRALYAELGRDFGWR
jgi:hypothetical protein